MTFIDLVLRHTMSSESPRKYYYWSALAAISAVINNQVYLDRFTAGKLFPNIYVLLVGKSGIRKGPPVALTTSLVEAVDNTRVIKGRASIQAIISDLALARTTANGGPPITDAIGLLSSDEFAAFLIEDPQALTILTQLHDTHYHKTWINRTKISGQEKLKNPCITLLAASNEAHLRDAMPEGAISGGFLARTAVIFSDKKHGSNPLTKRPEHMFPFDELVTPLREIAKVKGQFEWSPKGQELYELWYQEYDKMIMTEDDDETGTLERIHDQVTKTAMLISLSRKTDLCIEYADVEEAIRACQDFVPGSKRVALGQTGKSVSAPGTAVLLRALIVHPEHRLSRAEALQKYWRHFDAPELDRISASLLAQRGITVHVERDAAGKPDEVYVLNPKVLERLEAKGGKDGS